MPKLDQQRVQQAIDRAYDAEVANLFKIFMENVIEAITANRCARGRETLRY
jgi:hypothetical protein